VVCAREPQEATGERWVLTTGDDLAMTWEGEMMVDGGDHSVRGDEQQIKTGDARSSTFETRRLTTGDARRSTGEEERVITGILFIVRSPPRAWVAAGHLGPLPAVNEGAVRRTGVWCLMRLLVMGSDAGWCGQREGCPDESSEE